MLDAGYDVTRLACLLTDLPVELLGRVRSDRVCHFPAPPQAGTVGRPAKHVPEFALTYPSTHPEPDVNTTSDTSRYDTAQAWRGTGYTPLDQPRRRATARRRAADHRGTLIQLTVDRRPGDRDGDTVVRRVTEVPVIG